MAKRKEGEIAPSYILWTYSANAAGQHPVKVRVTHQRQRRYYSVFLPDRQKLFLSQKDFYQIASSPLQKLRGDNRSVRLAMDSAVQAAGAAVEESTNKGKTPFSFSQFERKYLGEEAVGKVLAFFKSHIERLDKAGQAGTARTYASAYTALSEFLNGRDIDPADLTVQRLYEFDKWLRTKRVSFKDGKKRTIEGKNDTSISIYMRCLRSIYNELAARDEYLLSVHPFSKSSRDKRYKVPLSIGQKGTTMAKDEIQAFITGRVDGELVPENPMYRAKQLLLFSFFAQGANFKDLALLRYSHVGKDYIEFDRQKTIRTRKEARRVRIPLTDELTAILVEQGNPAKRRENFIFNVFDAQLAYTEKKKDDLIRQWIKTTNKWLKRYCEFNDLPVVTTYSARHSFASLAKSTLPVAMISQMLGHSRITTTQTYLGRFDDDETRSGLTKVFKNVKGKVE